MCLNTEHIQYCSVVNILIGKYTISGRPGTFRKTSSVDVTSKDDQQTFTKSQFGPGPGGAGKTTLKATPGSKGGQPLEENELPLGDESLPWRRKDKTKDSLSAQKLLDQVPKFTQAQPWTNEQTKLRETHRDKEHVTEEILKVDISSETKLQDQMSKLIHTEDKTLIKVDERELVQQSKTSQVKDWRKPKQPQMGIQKYSDTEETSVLTIDEKDTFTAKSKDNLKTKDWRTTRQPESHTDDVSLLKISETEETSQISRKPESLNIPTESVPWNQQQIVLKKTPRERKEIPKEGLEQISLKPTAPEKIEVLKQDDITRDEKITSLRQVEDKHIIDITETEENILQKRARSKEGKFEEQTNETPKDKKLQVNESKSEIPKQKITPAEKEEGPIPWNKQQIALKKTHKGTKEESLEQTKLQEVERDTMQPLRFLKDEILIDVKENVTQVDDNKVVIEDTENKLERKSWRKEKIAKEEKETEVITEKAKEDESKPLLPKQVTSLDKQEEPIPWNKQQITLKKTHKEKKEDKYETEEVHLKAVQLKDKITALENVSEMDEKGIKPLQHLEDKSIIDIKETDTMKVDAKEETKLETKAWRKGKMSIDESIAKEEKPEFAEVPQEKLIKTDIPKHKILPQEKKEEPIPWNKQAISLKNAVKEKKEQLKEQIEDQSKLVKSEGQIIHSEDLIKTEVKEMEIKHLEDKSIVDINETEEIRIDKTPQEIKLEAKPWRKEKVSKDEKISKKEGTEMINEADEEEIKPHKPKHAITPQENKEEPIPWNKQKITLKKTIKEKLEEVKDKTEEVQLKPIKPQDKIIKSENVTEIQIKETESKPLQYVEDKSIIDFKESDTEIRDLKDKMPQETQIEIKSWRRGKIPEDEGIVKEKPEHTEDVSKKVEEKGEIKPHKPKQQIVPIERKEEPIPWNKQKIDLKKTIKDKADVKDKIEEVQLKPVKPEDEIIQSEGVAESEIETKPLQHIEDKSIVDIKETDKIEIKDVKDEMPQETKLWRKGKESADEKTSKEEKSEFVEEIPKELEEKIKPHKPKHQIVPEEKKEEPIPWNQQKITLKKTQKRDKEEVKENTEEVQLKPIKPEYTIMIPEEAKQIQPEIDKIEQKPSSFMEVAEDKSTADNTIQEAKLKVKSWRREKQKEKEIKEKPELLEAITTEVPEKEKQEDIQPQLLVQKVSSLDKVEEIIPWNKQQITLKRKQKEKKEVKEEVEDIQLKATKLEENILTSDDTVTKLYEGQSTQLEDKTDVHGETATELTEDKLETRSWRRDKVPKKDKDKFDSVEFRPGVDKSPIDDTKQEILETREWKRGKGLEVEKPKVEESDITEPTPIIDKLQMEDKKEMISSQQKPEEIIPWNKQSIVLKRAQKSKKEDTKEQMEEVLLKPLKPQTESIKPQETKVTETDIQSLKGTEDKIITDGTKQPEVQELKIEKQPDLKPETKSWRRGEKPKTKNQKEGKSGEEAKPLEAQQIPITEKVPASKEPLQNERPMEEKPEIKEEKMAELKSSDVFIKDGKVTEQISPWTEETVSLKPVPKAKSTLQKEEVESVTLKALKKKEGDTEIYSDISSEEEKELIIDKSKKKLKKKKKDLIPKDEQTETVQPKDTQIVREIPNKLSEIPETVIVETVTEVEDTVILKVTEEDKKKPKSIKKIEGSDITLETIKLKPVRKVEKVEEQDVTENVSLKPIPQKEAAESNEIKDKKRKEKRQKPEELSEIEDSDKYTPEVADKIETEEIPKEKKEKPSVPWRREVKTKEEKQIEENVPIKIGKGKLPDDKEIEDKVKLKPVKKDKKIIADIPEKTKHIKLPETDNELKEYEKQKIEHSEDKKEDVIEVKKMDKSIVPEEKLEAEEAIPEVSAPWRRTPKKKDENLPEIKEWPKGKRKPAPEEEKEQIQLKPISKEKMEEPIYKVETEDTKRDFAVEIPAGDYVDKIDIKPIKTSEKPDDEETEHKEAKPKEQPNLPETREWRRGRPKEEKAFDLEEIPTAAEEKPELIPTKIEDVVEEPQIPEVEKSETEIKLAEKKKKHPIQKKTEKPSEEEEVQFQKELDVQISSKKVKTEQRKIVSFDDSQPIPELEIISQKRTTEVLDKVPDENLTEDVDVQEKTVVQKSIVHKTIGKRAKSQTIAPKFIQRVEPVVAEKGKPAFLTCTVEGTPFPEITWYKNEAVFHANERVFINIVENTVTLEFSKVEPQDVAVYSCKATNPAGVATSTANLVILGSYVLAFFFSCV